VSVPTPTMQCVVDMGSPYTEARATVSAVDSSAQYPLLGVILAILTPRTRMML
jgi:hypothetical protein